jgi:hypothetical protein
VTAGAEATAVVSGLGKVVGAIPEVVLVLVGVVDEGTTAAKEE